MEAQFQDEFYKAFNQVAGRGVPICSEWSRSGNGRVDFYIPEKKWAIELLRDHDRVDEHIARFKTGGRYHSWFMDKMVNDWLIIDCAFSTSNGMFLFLGIIVTCLTHELVNYLEQHIWTAVFKDDYTTLSVYDHLRRPLIKKCLQK